MSPGNKSNKYELEVSPSNNDSIINVKIEKNDSQK